MCGIVGVAGNVSVNMEKVFTRLLELDTYRGPHSTGVFSVKSGGETVLSKCLGTPWDLADTKGYSSCFSGVCKVLLGHNRWATKGKISKQNAHPFEFKTLAGVHNGTLRTVTGLDDHKLFDVDSENIYHDMEKNGVYETIPKLDGAFALAWYDKVDATVNFIRNEERPLFFTYTEDLKTVLWASEPWMLIVAAANNDVEILQPQLLPVGVLHTFDIPQVYNQKITVRTRNIELFKPKYNTYTNNSFPKDKDKVTQLRPEQNDVKDKFNLDKFMNKEVEFSVGSKEKNSYGIAYIQCWLEEDSNIPVRVFAPEGGVLWEIMMSSTETFKAFIKTCGVDNNGRYLIADLRTVIEVENKVDTPVLTFIGFEQEEISLEEYKKRTHKGCAWCSSPVDENDADELVWFQKEDFICGGCAVQDEVKKYLVN